MGICKGATCAGSEPLGLLGVSHNGCIQSEAGPQSWGASSDTDEGVAKDGGVAVAALSTAKPHVGVATRQLGPPSLGLPGAQQG